MKRLTRSQQRLLMEMADTKRVILVQRYNQQTTKLRFSINAFPIRTIRAKTIAQLTRRGYLELNKRGYFVLTTKGMLIASLYKEKRR